MAQWKRLGAVVKELEANQGNQASSNNAKSSSDSSQVAVRNLPAYLQNWMKPRNTGAMAPMDPANGPFPGDSSPSPVENARSIALRAEEEPQMMSPPATMPAISNSKHTPTASVNSFEDPSQLQTPYRSTRGQKDMFQRTTSAAPTPRLIPATESTFAPAAIHLQPALKRRPKYTLKRIRHLDGEISVIPPELLRQFQQIARANKDSLLPFAKYLWVPSTNSAEKYADGSLRKWVNFPMEEQIKVGRFKYGRTHQFILAQAIEGSAWESGKVVVITWASLTSLGSRVTEWKVWRGPKLDAINSVRCARSHSAAIGNLQQSLPAERRLNFPDEGMSMGTTRRAGGQEAIEYSHEVREEATPNPYDRTSKVPKRGRESTSSFDSDMPISTQKRRTRNAAISRCTAVPTAARLSLEPGSLAVDQISGSRTHLAVPSVSPLSSPKSQSLVGDADRHTRPWSGSFALSYQASGHRNQG